MTPHEVLQRHAAVERVPWRVAGRELTLASKVGVPGAPGLDRGLLAFGEALTRGRAHRSGGPLVDATGGAGGLAALARADGLPARLLTASAAVRRAALASGTAADDVIAGFPWDLSPRSVAEAWWRPATERGRARLEAELAGWSRALDVDGTLWAVWHKDEGGKRAEARASEAYFERVEVVERSGGWRVCVLERPRAGAPAPDPWRSWQGPDGPMSSVAGSFAAGKLDAGSARLLAALQEPEAPSPEGQRVLDLGCGSGVLAARARALGAAAITAVDDDLAAVRSAEASLGADAGGGPTPVRIAWSDLTLDLPEPGEHDLALVNPPFHVGRQVVSALSQAFVAAALLALRRGGRLVLVANAALPYERVLEPWAAWHELAPMPGSTFKVLVARRS